MTADHGSAGTAGDHYLVDRSPHAWQPAPADWGARVVCEVCREPRGHANHRAAKAVAR